jgi:hypothetical protein
MYKISEDEYNHHRHPTPPTSPVVIPEPKKLHWYELDWLLPYKDLVGVAAFALAVTGAAMLNRPAALLLASALLFRLNWLMGSGKI